MYCDLKGSVLVNIFISRESLASISLPAGYFIVWFSVAPNHQYSINMLILPVTVGLGGYKIYQWIKQKDRYSLRKF